MFAKNNNLLQIDLFNMKEILANKKIKHVFGVSSHLAFYLCHKLIQTDAINADDCIFFTTRDYIYPKEYQSVYKNNKNRISASRDTLQNRFCMVGKKLTCALCDTLKHPIHQC